MNSLEERIKIQKILSDYLRENGTETFTKLISRAIDETGAHNNVSIHTTRELFINEFKRLSEFLLTER